MKFYELKIEVIKEVDVPPDIFISTFDVMEGERIGVTMSPEQAVIVAAELHRLGLALK